jgi:hypothetical protein
MQIPKRGSVQDRFAEMRERKWEHSVAEACRKLFEFGPERNSARKENPRHGGSTRLLIRVASSQTKEQTR